MNHTGRAHKVDFKMIGNSLKVIVDYHPSEADNAVISEGIIAHNAQILGERDKEFSIFLKNDSGEVLGGVMADVVLLVLWKLIILIFMEGWVGFIVAHLQMF